MSSVSYSTAPREIWTSEIGSMAAETATTRWPRIVQDMIDAVSQTLQDGSMMNERRKEGELIVQSLMQLKTEIEQDGILRPLTTDGSQQTEGYNTKLSSFESISWLDSPWLFAECYLYGRVNQLITGKTTWKDYDIFAQKKASALAASSNAVRELSARYMQSDLSTFSFDPLNYTGAKSDIAYRRFVEMTEIALWGNATDLSLLSKLSLDEIHSLQGSKAIEEGQARIVSNDTRAAWDYLCSRTKAGRIDIVLDNAGFELFTDLVYCLYLLDAGLASEIVLHPKSIPWFVSDVTPEDVDILLSTLSESADFRDKDGHTQTLAQQLKNRLSSGLIQVKEHRFWSTGFDFQAMAQEAPDLFEALCTSTLVVFKGDLNYRKLVRDATWAHSTPFKSALGPLRGAYRKGADGVDSTGPKILALRTNKADVCVGVPEEALQKLETEAPRKAWVRNGKYAVISFSDGI